MKKPYAFYWKALIAASIFLNGTWMGMSQDNPNLVPGTRWIEVEDFNGDRDGNGVGGEWISGANGGPNGDVYSGGAYAGVTAIHGVDYNESGSESEGLVYRHNALLDDGQPVVQFAGFNGAEAQRSGFNMTDNYKIGWTAPGDWYNYTRDFPDEPTEYEVYARMSGADTDLSEVFLERVNGDPSSGSQSTERLGALSGPVSGDWGIGAFYRMHEEGNPDNKVDVTLSGTVTLRLVRGGGNLDYDAIAFVPLSALPPKITESDPADGSLFVSPGGGFSFTAASPIAPIAEDAIQVTANGVDITSELEISGTENERRVQWPGPLEGNVAYQFEISAASENGTRVETISFDTFTESGTVLIEAEDFNFEGGGFYQDPILCNPLGGQDNCYFDKLGIPGVDERDTLGQTDDGEDFDLLYRYGPGVEREEETDTLVSEDTPRDKFTGADPNPFPINDYDLITFNTGDWVNYTRDFPEGSYKVFLRARADANHQISLGLVDNPTSENQTVSNVGTFAVSATNGKYHYTLMTDASGQVPLTINLSGEQTVRLTAAAADGSLAANFILFVPAEEGEATPPIFTNLQPGDGAVGAARDALIAASIKDGTTAVDESSVVMLVNGVEVDAEVGKANGITSISYQPPEPFGNTTDVTVVIRFTDDAGAESSANWSFRTAFDFDLTFAEGARWIELEDFNADIDGDGVGGEWVPGANGGANGDVYSGGQYAGLSAVHNVDYFEQTTGADAMEGNDYRHEALAAEGQPRVQFAAHNGGNNPNRGPFALSGNYKIGWTSGGDWYQYTRDFPSEETNYDVYLSVASGGADPLVFLEVVDGDPTQPDPATTRVGQFTGPASGDWGTSAFYRMQVVDNPDRPAQTRLSGEQTLRVVHGGGALDWDALAFVEANELPPEAEPLFLSSSPSDGAVNVDIGSSIVIQMENGASSILENSISLTLNGAEVSHSVSVNGNNVTITHDPPNSLSAFTNYEVELTYSSTSGVDGGVTFTFMTGVPSSTFVAGTRWIEVEDFNSDVDGDGTGGEWVAGANGGATGTAYSGGEYAGLSAIHDIDYHEEGGTFDGNAYRQQALVDAGEVAVQFAAFNNGNNPVRGDFTLTDNYKIGWTAAGEWYNYTRDYPESETTYRPYLAMSGADSDLCQSFMEIVSGDPSQADQTTERIGEFSGPVTGDWGTGMFYPMHEVGDPGTPAFVTLSGVATVRLIRGAGNSDWEALALVPVDGLPPAGDGAVLEITQSADDQVTISWDTSGTLQSASGVNGPYTDVAGSSSPHSAAIEGGSRYYRVQE